MASGVKRQSDQKLENVEEVPKAKTSTGEVQDAIISAFVQWCNDRNFQISPKVIVTRHGTVSKFGMVAISDIKCGDCLFQVPRENILMPETCTIASLLSRSSPTISSDSGWVPLLLALMYEYNNPQSPWRPYLDLVPDREDLDLPICWTPQERHEFLQGTQIPAMTETDLQLIYYDFHKVALPFVKNLPNLFPPVCQTLTFYLRMVSFVMAYSFMEPINPALDPSDTEQEKAPPMLVPMADILNHVSKHNAELSYGATYLKMIAIKDIEKGEEVFNTYGMLDNAQLLNMYGFAELFPANINETVTIPIRLLKEVAEQLDVHKQKPDLLLCKWNYMQNSNVGDETDEFIIGMKGFLTRYEVLICLKILHMEETAFNAQKDQGFDEDLDMLFSDDNEENEEENNNDDDDDDELLKFKHLKKLDSAWRRTLRICAEKCLERYRTSLAEDTRLLNEGQVNTRINRQRYAFYTTYSQKKLLQRLIHFCRE